MTFKIIEGGRADAPKPRKRPLLLFRKRRLTIGQFGNDRIATTGRWFTVRDGR